MDQSIFVIFGLVVLAITTRLIAGSMDRERIRAYVERGRGKMLSLNWTPFGTGWYGDKSDRIYSIRYLDSDGNEHYATCKTSLFAGVYFSGDCIVQYATAPPRQLEGLNLTTLSSLERENRRLREELDRLKGGSSGRS